MKITLGNILKLLTILFLFEIVLHLIVSSAVFVSINAILAIGVFLYSEMYI